MGYKSDQLELKAQALRLAGMVWFRSLTRLVILASSSASILPEGQCLFCAPCGLMLAIILLPVLLFPLSFIASVWIPYQLLGIAMLLPRPFTANFIDWFVPANSSSAWAQVIGPGFSLNGHWSLVRDSRTENFKNDLLWLIALRAVTVRYFLQNWGVTDSGTCASCPLRETTDHCFLNCMRVKKVWLVLHPLLYLF